MGCLCAGHACGDDAKAPCDTDETSAMERSERREAIAHYGVEGARMQRSHEAWERRQASL